jgi:hypothetical protein
VCSSWLRILPACSLWLLVLVVGRSGLGWSCFIEWSAYHSAVLPVEVHFPLVVPGSGPGFDLH